MAAQQPAAQEGGGPMGAIQKAQDKFTEWFKKQPFPVEVAFLTAGGSAQGAVLGGVMGTLAKNQPTPPPGQPNPFAANPAMSGGPWVQARNFAVLTGVNAGLAAVVKKWRGKDDCQTAMIASFGSGAAFSVVSGMGNIPPAPGQPAPGPLPSAIVTGAMFALFQGAFYQIGKTFFNGGDQQEGAEDTYVRTRYMLSTLGLEKYEKNFKKGMLDDSTLLLLNDSSLAEVKIPPGPRLHIMHHLDGYRNVLKPGMPIAMPPLPPSAEQK